LRYDVDSNPLVAVADVWVYDDSGELILTIERYAMRAFSGAGREVTYHQVVLESIPWPQVDEELLPGSVLVVGPASEAARGLAALTPRWGDRVQWVDSAALDGPDGLDAVADKVDLAVHVLPRVPLGDDAALAEALDQQLAVSIALPRRLAAGGRLVTLGAAALAPNGDPVDPFAYAALAAARVVQMESPRITTVGISDDTLDLARAVRLGWADELAGRKVHVDGETLRGEALRPHLATQAARSIEPGTTVLMTGAFGGIGTEYLSALWRDYQADVVVLGRTSLEQLESSDTGDDRERAARIRALEAQGLTLRFVQCDLADTSAVRSAVAALRASGTRIGGVVHLAGVPEDGMLFRKDAAALHHVVAPKALAAAALVDELGDEPDFFITSSSMTTIVGAPGQFGYTLANAYLEGLARAGTGVSAIRWPGWKETGMATRFGVGDASDDTFLIRALPTAEGAEYVRRSLAGRCTDLVVGDLTAAAGPMLSPWLTLDAPAAPAASVAPTAAAPSATTPDGPAPTGEPAAATEGGFAIKDWESLTVTGAPRELDELEKFITVLFASVLDITEIDVRSSFTDLGGDSLKAFSIYTPLVDHLKVDLEVADIFIHGAVLELSEHVRSLQGA
ncbi:MAG: hypothetical protein JWP82_1822, partial [Humibacillus sp.]|nr:hypothetical protein [Humibacillus sp.]